MGPIPPVAPTIRFPGRPQTDFGPPFRLCATTTCNINFLSTYGYAFDVANRTHRLRHNVEPPVPPHPWSSDPRVLCNGCPSPLRMAPTTISPTPINANAAKNYPESAAGISGDVALIAPHSTDDGQQHYLKTTGIWHTVNHNNAGAQCSRTGPKRVLQSLAQDLHRGPSPQSQRNITTIPMGTLPETLEAAATSSIDLEPCPTMQDEIDCMNTGGEASR